MDITELDLNDNDFSKNGNEYGKSTNFGGGLELLMNDKVKESNKLKRSIKKSGYTLPHGYQTKKAVRMSGINTQIGAIKKGSKFIYYCGIRIEKKPIEVLVGNKKKKQYVYIVNTGVYHTLQSAKAWIRYLAK